jgi:hypothetical protein
MIVEDEDKADATWKESGDDQVFTDTFRSSGGINAQPEGARATAPAAATIAQKLS